MNIKETFHNLRYIVSANLFTFVISIVTSLMLPNFLGVDDYSYWQLYVFYISYAVFFTFGYTDGFHLEIGGEYLDELNKKKITNNFLIYISTQIIGAVLLFTILLNSEQDSNKLIVLVMTILTGAVLNLRAFFFSILQGTNEIKYYAKYTKLDRIIYFFFIIVMIVLRIDDYRYFLFFDFICRLWVLILCFFKLKSSIFVKVKKIHLTFNNLREYISTSSAGLKILFGAMGGAISLGIIRWLIEKEWSIIVFGKLSFTLSMINLMMTFVNAIGTLIFPILRRSNQSKIPTLYNNLKELLIPILFSLFLLFFPIAEILSKIFVEYIESFYFMGIIFPMFIFEALLTIVYLPLMKNFRMEKQIFIINFISLTVITGLSLFSVFVLKNLILTIFLIVLSSLLRSIVCEYTLDKMLKSERKGNYFIEILLTMIFIIFNIYFDRGISFWIYLVVILVYLICKLVPIKNSIIFFKQKF